MVKLTDRPDMIIETGKLSTFNLLVGNYGLPPLEHMAVNVFYMVYGTLIGSIKLELRR